MAMGVKSTKMSQKINAKYKILLHLQLVRLGLGLSAFMMTLRIPPHSLVKAEAYSP